MKRSLIGLSAARKSLSAVFALIATAVPAYAETFQFDLSGLGTAAQGAPGRSTYRTGRGAGGTTASRVSNQTTRQNAALTLHAGTMGLAPIFGSAGGLPPTSLDSFVVEAGGSAEAIYGDEGTEDIPPYFGFDQSHRINAGIVGDDSGLTTGHGSMLPNAWGGDEFDQPEAFTMSGTNGGNYYGASGGVISGAQGVLAGQFQDSRWAENHPRQTQVLTQDSNLLNQINANYGNLGGNYNRLTSQANSIQNQDFADAAQNGGYITLQQQAQLDHELTALKNNVSTSLNDSGF